MALLDRASWLVAAVSILVSGGAVFFAWRRAARHRGAARRLSREQLELQRSLDDARSGLAQERVRLKTLVESLPDAVILANMRGEVLSFNAEAMPVLGAAAADVRHAGRALYVPLDTERWRMRVQEMLKKHAAGEDLETRSSDGVPAFHRLFVTMFNDPGSGDFGVLLMLRNVTAERRLDALKEEFFQSVGRDLSAPLLTVRGCLRLLRESMSPTELQGSWLDEIDRSCETLSRLVDDALDVARVENGRLEIPPAPIESRSTLQRVARLFAPAADERGVALAVEIDAPSVSFEADGRLIERLLRGLIDNALKFTPRGGRVAVSAAARGGQIEFVVEDDGPGVPENRRAVIFEKFGLFDGSGPRPSRGLGLSVCAKIVKLHRGVIWVEPGRVVGSRFIARLPLRQSAGEADRAGILGVDSPREVR